MSTNDDTTETSQDEIASVLAELEELKAQLAQADGGGAKRRFGTRTRGVITVVGVLLSCLLLVAAVLGIWARRSLLHTDVFTDRAGDLIDEPEIQTALAQNISGQISELIDAEDVIADALPEQASLLAAPLSGAVDEFVADRVSAVVSSDTFADLWRGAVELAHSQAVDLLKGSNPLVETNDETITINLLPVINEILGEITSASPEIFGRTVDIPDVTIDDVPDDARDTIGDALGITLDDDFGTFTVYDDGALSAAQQAVTTADKLVVLLAVLAVLIPLGTIWLSQRRRRTILQLAVGFTIGMVLIRRLSFIFSDDLRELITDPVRRAAVGVAGDAILNPLQQAALWIGWASIAAIVVAAVTGPYPWAERLRSWAGETSGSIAGSVSDRAGDEQTQDWVADNQDALRIGGAVVALLGLFLFDLSWIGFLVLVGVVGAYELAVSRLADQSTDPVPAPDTGGD